MVKWIDSSSEVKGISRAILDPIVKKCSLKALEISLGLRIEDVIYFYFLCYLVVMKTRMRLKEFGTYTTTLKLSALDISLR